MSLVNGRCPVCGAEIKVPDESERSRPWNGCGTLFPMVVMGTLVGTLFALVATHIFGIPMAYAPNFIAMGVAGIFAGAVRAPVTGVVLIFELTGSLEALMAMSAVAIVSYVTANILRVDPFDEQFPSFD